MYFTYGHVWLRPVTKIGVKIGVVTKIGVAFGVEKVSYYSTVLYEKICVFIRISAMYNMTIRTFQNHK